MARALLEPVGNQSALTVEHEAYLGGADLTHGLLWKALVAVYPKDDLLVPFLDTVGLRMNGHRDGNEQGN